MSAVTFIIKDETTGGKVINEVEVVFPHTRTTVMNIIRSRVTAEVEAYNRKMPACFKGRIEPTDAEKTLNGCKLKEKRKADPEQQCKVALDAFEKNGYFSLSITCNLNQQTRWSS